MIDFHVLASGSKGNCSIISSKGVHVMIDCGTTRTYIQNALTQISMSLQDIHAVLITHTHKDHISQLKYVSKVPIYTCVEVPYSHYAIRPCQSFYISHIKVSVIPLSHDCENTVGFIIEDDDEKCVYITDTGYVSNAILPLIENADYYIFESNHDVEMLMQTSRPMYIKQRIIGDNGHLCNQDSANIISKIINSKTKEIVLAHISEEGNHRELAKDTLIKTLKKQQILSSKVTIQVAQQYNIVKRQR